jgi:hypothetical protein
MRSEAARLTAAIGAAEGPVLLADRDAAERALGSIVGEADPPIIEEAGEAPYRVNRF